MGLMHSRIEGCISPIFLFEVKSLDELTTKSPVIRNDMFGRLDIYASYDDISEENLIAELNSALVYHVNNMLQEEFLYWYTRGVQPILNRRKEIREDILNVV